MQSDSSPGSRPPPFERWRSQLFRDGRIVQIPPPDGLLKANRMCDDITKRKILCFGHWTSGHWKSGHDPNASKHRSLTQMTIRSFDFPMTQMPQNIAQLHRKQRRSSDLVQPSHRFVVVPSLGLFQTVRTAITAGIRSLHHTSSPNVSPS